MLDKLLKWILEFIILAVLTGIASAWLYDRYVTSKKPPEFDDPSPFSVAMRQCYSVPENYTRVLIFPTVPTVPSSEIPPEMVNLKGRLAPHIAVVDFDSLKALFERGYVSLYESAHLTELRDLDSNKVIVSFRAEGIAAFDVQVSRLNRSKFGFSRTGRDDGVEYGSGALAPAHSGKCTIVNLILFKEGSL